MTEDFCSPGRRFYVKSHLRRAPPLKDLNLDILCGSWRTILAFFSCGSFDALALIGFHTSKPFCVEIYRPVIEVWFHSKHILNASESHKNVYHT